MSRTQSTKLGLFISVIAVVTSVICQAGPKDQIKDYAQKVREASESFAKMAKEAKGDKEAILSNKTFSKLAGENGFPKRDQDRIAQAIADGKLNVVTALYASIAAKDLLKQKSIDLEGADEGIVAILNVAAVSGKGKASNKDLSLTNDEMKDAGQALAKKTAYTIDMLTWTKEEADVHVAVMKRTAEIFTEMEITAEESLILAIMEVKNIDKEAALKIVRKLRDCV